MQKMLVGMLLGCMSQVTHTLWLTAASWGTVWLLLLLLLLLQRRPCCLSPSLNASMVSAMGPGRAL
jgi:hypothetical protein